MRAVHLQLPVYETANIELKTNFLTPQKRRSLKAKEFQLAEQRWGQKKTNSLYLLCTGQRRLKG